MYRRSVAVVLVIVVVVTGTNGFPDLGRRPNDWENWYCSHWYNIPWLSGKESAFESKRIPEMRTLIGTCAADVGRCPIGSCSTRTYRTIFNCPDDGFIVEETEDRVQDCGIFGNVKYQRVTKCKCELDRGVVVEGMVLDSTTNQPLKNMIIWFGKKNAANTGADGKFKNIIESDVRSLVVRSQDKGQVYMDAVRTVDIPKGFRGPVQVKLFMIKKGTPVKIDSTLQTTLSLSDEPTDGTAGNARIEIPANNFKTLRGKPYSGPVNVGVTFIETSGASEEVIPGQFLTPVGGTLENMISDGIVSFSFKDPQGNDLRAEEIKFIVREGMTLWNLNTATGFWEPMKTTSGRRRRQVTLNEFLVRVIQNQWYNIDKIPGAPRCYFKARIFNATSGDEISSSLTTSFRPEITAFTNLMQRLRLYAPSTSTPNVTCYEVRCPVVANPNDALVGFINMTATEVVSVGGAYLPYVTHLTPRVLSGYAAAIQTELSDVQYDIAPNNLDVFVNFVSDSAGPFYPDQATCEASTINQPALHFFKPAPPSYLPVPEDTEICTARIAFRDRWMFYNYTSGLTTLPNLTAISVWEESGTQYYFTNTVSVEVSTVAGEEFVFACIQYRCSKDNESTTVYLDIEIPTVNVTYNYTDQNGTVRNYTYTTQNFSCWGNCTGSFCGGKSFASTASQSFIEGSFVAPANVTSGPDFYDSTNTDCQSRLGSEPFAYEFNCYYNRKERLGKK